MDEAALARVERQRSELEGQIVQLRKSLRHWQTLEIDYEGLKEEFSLLSDDCSTQEVLEVANDFAAELVDEQEIRSLFGVDKGIRRTPAQVIDLLSKRVEYVSKNALTIKKQLSEAEKKRNALLLAKEPEYRDEAGLPLTEVTEELDDDGNILSSKLETAQSAAPQLMEVLGKAGVGGLVEKDGIVTASSNIGENSDLNLSSQSASLVQNDNTSQPEKKRPKTEHPEFRNATRSAPDSTTRHPKTSADQNQIVQESLQGRSPADPDDQSTSDSADFPTNPDDTEEDAALRREMLEYAHSEIGPIVAQLELEEDGSDISYDENEDQFSQDSESDDDTDEEEESEDEYGQTKHPVISDRYRRKMEKLEKRLGFNSMQNLGPEPDLPADVANGLNKPPAAEAARRAAIGRAEAVAKAFDEKAMPIREEKPPSKKSKKVSFANDLGIAMDVDVQPPVKGVSDNSSKAASLPPVHEAVVERVPATLDPSNPASAASQRKKVSRFKADRGATPPTPLSPPPHSGFSSSQTTKTDFTTNGDEVMSAAIVERPEPLVPRKAPPPSPYDFDETLHRQEVADEYYKSRNKMIQRQGGFVRHGEDDNFGEFTAPLAVVDEGTGKVKKISRFKAARLR